MTLGPAPRTLAAALLAIGVVAGLLAAPAPAGAAPGIAGVPVVEAGAARRAPDTGRPVVGDCHAVTPRENAAFAEPDRAVSCTERHTTVTFEVVTVRRAALSSPDRALATALRACRPALPRALLGSERTLPMSAYSITVFGPTRRQRAAGARWLRCDVYLPVGGTGLRPLPTTGPPVLGRRLPLPNAIARCGVLTRTSFLRTVCTARHSHRARGTHLVRSQRYPGDAAVLRIARRHCPRIAGRQFYATWPSASLWRFEPQARIVCYQRTTR